MKNLEKVTSTAKGLILVGAITALLYGMHDIQNFKLVKEQLSLGKRQPAKQEVYAVKDSYKNGILAGIGLAGLGAGMLYFSRRKSLS